MRADDAQTMVARCLVEPRFLASARGPVQAPDAAGKAAVVAPGDPLESLVLFRGFITRIKHNGMRKIAPLTLRLLHAYNLDVAFFAAIAPAYLEARKRGPLPPPQLFIRFEEELTAYLPRLTPDVRLTVEAVLRHEGRIWRTESGPRDEAPGSGPKLAPGAGVEHFAVDVLDLCANLSSDPHGPAPEPSRRDQFLFYLPEGRAARLFEIDAVSACVLSRLDGCRGLDQVCRDAAAAMDFATPDLIADLIEDAASHGMVLLTDGGRAC